MIKILSTYFTTTFLGGCIIGYYHGKSRYKNPIDHDKIMYEAVVTACFSPLIIPIHLNNFYNKIDLYKDKKCPYLSEIK